MRRKAQRVPFAVFTFDEATAALRNTFPDRFPQGSLGHFWINVEEPGTITYSHEARSVQ